MTKDAGPESSDQEKGRRFGWKPWLGMGLAAPLVAGVAMIPADASGENETLAHDHSSHQVEAVPDNIGARLARVRAATARFHNVEAAREAGYELGWVNGAGVRIVAGCVSHPTAGAMGFHYFNAALMADNAVSATEPEALVYAPSDDGGLELVAVEWVARSARSNPPGVSSPPSVLGMEMHILVPPPGPAFYLTHAWVWADNPSGMFADWNPDVSCS